MSVRILFFASLREATGTAGIELAIEGTVPLEELLRRLADRLPADAFAALQAENVRIAVNQTLTAAPHRTLTIRAGDEIAFLPPVTGG